MVGLFGKESTPFSSCFTFYRLLVLESTTNSYVESNSRLEAILTLICPDLAYCNLGDIQECESVHCVVYCSKIIDLGQIVSIRRNGEQESNSWLD